VSKTVLYVPPFDGPENIGLNVATVLMLQLFRTLRKTPSPNPTEISFAEASLLWGESPLREPSHRAAEQAAADLNARLVFWGRAANYADGVLVQPFLTLAPVPPKATTSPEMSPGTWRLTLREGANGGEPLLVERGLPANGYAFEPIVLRKDVISRYRTPRALKVYTDKSEREEVAVLVGGAFRARKHEADGTWLVEPARGWLPLTALPTPSGRTHEAVAFAGGVMRYLRTDWVGAAQLMRKVLDNPLTPTAVRVDALLYLGLSAEMQQRSGRREFEKALALNSLSQPAAAYLIMDALAVCLSGRSAGRSTQGARLDRAKELLDKERHLFEPTDPWFASATAMYDRLRKTERP
jgi:hypothetical protein